MKLPLEGIKVLDFSVWMFGSVGAAHLADMGAEVIKVENPKGGDPGRGLLSSGVVPLVEWNMYFGNNNRNKKSLAIDLYDDRGREVISQRSRGVCQERASAGLGHANVLLAGGIRYPGTDGA